MVVASNMEDFQKELDSGKVREFTTSILVLHTPLSLTNNGFIRICF